MRLIEVKETDEFFNRCTCCRSEKDTKKIVIGDKRRTTSIVLCRDCRAELYNKLKNNFEGDK